MSRRQPRDPNADARVTDEPDEDLDQPVHDVPEGFIKPNARPAPPPARVHPNDPDAEAVPLAAPSPGPAVVFDDEEAPVPAAPAVPVAAEPAPDGAPGEAGKKAKKAKPAKEKKAKKTKKGKRGKGASDAAPGEGVEAAEAMDASETGEDEEDKDGAAAIVSGHRFGLRLGSHGAGNLITKLKARFSKSVETVAEVVEKEEEEAASERIEPNERYKEIETYPIHPPYAYVRILFDDEKKDYIYQVLEPLLTKTETEILDFIEHTLVDNLTVSPEELEDADELQFITDRFNDVIFDYSIILHEDEAEEEAIKKKLLYYLRRNFIGHGPVDVQMNDPYIEDISCDGPHVPIFLYHRKYESMRSTTIFGTHEKLDAYVIKMAQRSGKHISVAEPILDATMTDGSRLQATLGQEVSAGGSTFTIRKFRPDPFTPPDLVLFRTMSAEMLAYLWISVQNGASIMYAGGTASGKTTSLNAILLFIPPNMKIVSIEDTREVNLPHENWIAGITRNGFGPRDQFGRQAGEIDMFQLLKNALRQRPEYIIVGEVRGQEAYSLFQAMATGHAAYGTMHADSVDAVIHRLESDPINIPRSLLEALDIVSVQIQTRVGGKRVRRTKQISEIVGLDPHTREILTNEVFRWVPADDSFKFSGVSYILERIQIEKGMQAGSMVKELTRRAEIIEWMIRMHIQDYQDVSRVVSAYYKEPEIVLGLVRGDIPPDEAPAGLRQLAMRGDAPPDDTNPLSAAALASAPGTGNVKDAGGAPSAPAAVAQSAALAPPAAEPVADDDAAHAEAEAPMTDTAEMVDPIDHAEPAEPDEPAWHPAPEPAAVAPQAPAAAPPEPHAEPPSPPTNEPAEGEEWLRSVEEKIRARYEELERRKREEAKRATAEGGEGN